MVGPLGSRRVGVLVAVVAAADLMINTDNGTDWMTVTGNASWNTGPSNSWAYCTRC